MDELRERMQVFDRLEMPDLWPRSDIGEQHEPVALGLAFARRLAIVAAALIIAAAGIGFGLARLGGPSAGPSPAATPTEPVPVRAEVTATIDTGKPFPEGVTIGDGGVWIATRDMDGGGDLLRLDPTTGQIVATIPMTSLPGWEFGGAGITSGLGSVWVFANDERGVVLHQIDPATDEVARSVVVGDGLASDVWVDETGVWVLVSSGTHLYTLSQLDPTTLDVIKRIEIPADWSNSVFAAGGWIWVLVHAPDQGDLAPPETLVRIDPSTGSIVDELQPTGGSSFFVTPSSDRIWFWHQGLRALDATTGQEVVGPVDLPDDCCASRLADGAGGVWIVTIGADGGSDAAGVWHVTRDGEIDRHADVNLGPKADGIAGAFDPATQTVWVVHYERTVSEVQITPAEGQDVSATNTGQ